MQLLKSVFTDTLHLFYPHICCGCGSDIVEDKDLLCIKCIDELPHTAFEKFCNNPIEKIFWGRIRVEDAYSEFYFTKDSLMQNLIHQLKYKGNTNIGSFLGQIMGRSILKSGRFSDIDAIIPLPLFPEKEKIRGYNQSMVISKGISSITGIPVFENAVIRQKFTETQTKKHRTERWENVDGSFSVKDPQALEGKKLLLVDDVITTGASLEACGNAILKTENTLLCIATLAVATK
jgi:ComF family protein